MKKRFPAFILAIAMMATMIPSAFAATLPADVANSWCKDYVADLMDKGIVSGYTDGTYRPTANLSRGAIAKMAFLSMKAAGSSLQESTENDPFTDMKGNWAEGYASVLAHTGNLLPSEFGYKYEAGKDMSRLDTAKLLTRIYLYAHPEEKLAGSVTLDFTDTSSISAADAPLVAKAVELGIINGYQDGSFKPAASINRGTAAAMMSRFLKTVGTISDPAEFAVSTGGNGQISTDTTGAPEIKNVEWVIKPSIQSVDRTSFSPDGMASYSVTKNDANPIWVDTSGKTYQFADTHVHKDGFRFGYATAMKVSTGKYGIINASGKWVVEPKYDKANGFKYICYNDGSKLCLCSVILNGEATTFDRAFNVVEGIPEKIPDIDWEATNAANGDNPSFEGVVSDSGGDVLGDGTKDGLFVYSKLLGSGGLRQPCHGICDANGRVIVRATAMTSSYGEDPLHGSYDVGSAHDDCIVLEHRVSIQFDVIKDIYDGKTGKLLFTCGNSQRISDYYGVPYRPFRDNSYGQGLFVAENEDGVIVPGTMHPRRGYMNKYGEMVIPAIFDDAEPFANGYAWVQYDGLWGVIKLPNF